MSKLNNKVAIITGSSRGIGLQIAKTLAGNGVKVVINSKSSIAEGQRIADTLSDAIYIQADVSDETQCQNLIENTLNKFRRLDFLINNATFPIEVLEHKQLQALSDQSFHGNFNANVMAAWYLSRLSYDYLKKSHGLIINISSVAGIKAMGANIAYCVAKSGLNHLTRLLAKAFAPEVRVNAIAPGYIQTDRTQAIVEKFNDELFKNIPLQKIGSSEDIAVLVLGMIHCQYMTGQVVAVDGGLTL